MTLSDSDIIAVHQLLSLWGHLLDCRELHRLPEVLTEDATYDARVFGFHVPSGIPEIVDYLNNGQHALFHHATNIYVYYDTDGTLCVKSKGIGLLRDNVVSSVTFYDRLEKGAAGWRIKERVAKIHSTADTAVSEL